jgi:hypothetical protein
MLADIALFIGRGQPHPLLRKPAETLLVES